MKTHRCKLRWTALFLVLVLSVSLVGNFTVLAGESFTTVYFNLFEENADGWHSFSTARRSAVMMLHLEENIR